MGGGIAGLTVAWELARRGVGVRLYEQGALGAGASGRNTGTLLHQVEPEVAAMFRESVAVYSELLEGPVDFGWTRHDELLLAADERQWGVARAKADPLRAQGVRVEELSADDLHPWFGHAVRGGLLLPDVYALDANAVVHAVAEAARAAGATLVTGTRVGLVRARGGRVEGVVTDAGAVAADAVVLASGPWLTDLLPGAPVRAGRGWLMRTARLPEPVPWIVEELSWPDQAVLGRAAAPQPLAELAGGPADTPVGESFVICPQPGGEALLGASLSMSLRDAVEGVDAPRRMAQRALAVAPGLARTAAVTRAWSGLRPMTADGLPVVGPTGIDGLYVHGGHASLGMQAAPATARWLAAAMTGEPADPVLARLHPRRFDDHEEDFR